eukprot:scaffold16844_cov119-Isochrysis_galbana.AAC.2
MGLGWHRLARTVTRCHLPHPRRVGGGLALGWGGGEGRRSRERHSGRRHRHSHGTRVTYARYSLHAFHLLGGLELERTRRRRVYY